MLTGRVATLLKSEGNGQETEVRGWVRTRRGNKQVAFIAVNDGSTIHNIQIVADLGRFSEDSIKKV
ncbi:MAG: asparagine--tRNA ligase, partial [Flavobacteriales bacterium]